MVSRQIDRRILRLMSDSSELTAREIRSFLDGSTQQAVRGSLVRLCAKGMVERYGSPDPRVRYVYRITDRRRSREGMRGPLSLLPFPLFLLFHGEVDPVFGENGLPVVVQVHDLDVRGPVADEPVDLLPVP